MERKTLQQTQELEKKRDDAVLVGLRSPVLHEDSADEESLAELAALVDTAGGRVVGTRTASSARARSPRCRIWCSRSTPRWSSSTTTSRPRRCAC